ncbi:MAG: glycosyltransferase family 87 protein [Anaerolineales bacterium]
MDKLRRGLKIVLVVAWLAAGLAFVWRVFIPSAQTITFGFIGYYTSSWLLVHGRWAPQAYDDDYYRAQVLALSGGEVGDVLGFNSPAMALIFLPLVWLSPQQARWAWTAANVVLLVLAGWLTHQALARNQTMSAWLWLGLSALALVYAPLIENFRFGQAYGLLLCLYALGLWGLLVEKNAFAGLGLGLATLLKLSGAPVWLMLAVRRWARWPWALYGMAAGLVLVSIPLVSPAMYLAFFRRFQAGEGYDRYLTLTVFQTTSSFFAHFLRFDPDLNPRPLANFPQLATGLTWAVTLASLAFTLWRSRAADLALAFATATILSVVLFPMAEQYHYTLLLLPLAVLAVNLAATGASWRWVMGWAAAAALLSVPLPYRADALSTGWLSLLAYPRLYGGWLLWGLLMARMKPTAPQGS